MKFLSLIFAICMTSRIAPIFGRFYVLRDDEGGAYFFEESDLRSKNPTKSYYFMTPDDYKGSGELVTSIHKNNAASYDGYESEKDYETNEEEDQNRNVETLDADVYEILKNLKGLKLLVDNNESVKKPKYKLIPGDFQSKVKKPKYKASVESFKNTDETFLGLPTSHLSSIIKLLDDFASERDGSQLVGRTLLPNVPHVELNTGIPKNEKAGMPQSDLVKKLEMLIEQAQKNVPKPKE